MDSDSAIHGIAKSYEEFKEKLRNYEIETVSKFIVRQSAKGFLDEKRVLSADLMLHWKDGLPYFHLGTRVYNCHLGKDKYIMQKKKYAENKDPKSRNYNISGSKKVNCPSIITVKRVFALPQFQVKVRNPVKYHKNKVSSEIKYMLENQTSFEVVEAFWYTFPSKDSHNHLMGEVASKAVPLDPMVRSKILEIVRGGERDASVVSKLIETYVTTNLQQFDKSRRRFFPDISKIKMLIKSVRTGNKRKVSTNPRSTRRREKKANIVSVENCEKAVIQPEENLEKAVVLAAENCEKAFMQPEENLEMAVVMAAENCENAGMKSEDVIYEYYQVPEAPEVNSDDSEEESDRMSMIKKCNSHIRKLRMVMQMLPETELIELENDLLNITEKMKLRANQGNVTRPSAKRKVGMNQNIPTECINVIIESCNPAHQYFQSSTPGAGSRDFFTDCMFPGLTQ